MTFLKAAKIESRFGAVISRPIKVFRFGSGAGAPPEDYEDKLDSQREEGGVFQ
jgi:hypothetical protein